MQLSKGSASVVINRPPADVFAAIADITRMGEWSPENTGGRWIEGATGPDLGARFEGDNVAKVGPVTIKRWTTVSEVSQYTPDEVFEFVCENYTTWRYELSEEDGATRIVESYRHKPYEGVQKFMYETLGRRSTAIPAGMQATLDRLRDVLEAEGAGD